MKKLAALLLAVTICLCLFACGDNDRFSGEDGSVFSLAVKLNPEFEIFLDESGCITKVMSLNRDAKTAFDGVELQGYDFELGFRRLLDAAYEKGYISRSGAEMSVKSFKLEASGFDDSAVMDSLYKVAEEFSANTGVGFSIVYEGITVVGESAAEPAEQQPQQNRQPEQQAPENEGTYETNHSFSDGVYKEFYEADVLVKRETTLNDGTYIEEYFGTAGNLTREIRHNSDGSSSDAEFDGEGRTLSMLAVTPEGVIEESTFEYYDSGAKKTQYTVSSEKEQTVTYYESGAQKSSLRHGSDGSCHEEHLTESGTTTYTYDLQPGGDYVKLFYDTACTLLSSEISAGGEVSVVSYRPDGTMAEEYVYCADGSVWYNVFDAAGHQILEQSRRIQ